MHIENVKTWRKKFVMGSCSRFLRDSLSPAVDGSTGRSQISVHIGANLGNCRDEPIGQRARGRHRSVRRELIVCGNGHRLQLDDRAESLPAQVARIQRATRENNYLHESHLDLDLGPLPTSGDASRDRVRGEYDNGLRFIGQRTVLRRPRHLQTGIKFPSQINLAVRNFKRQR